MLLGVRYILDTDHISLAQRGHPLVSSRILLTPPEQLATTVVTIQEQLQGRLAQIQQAVNQSALIDAYERLHHTVRFHRTVQVLDFDEASSAIFVKLQKLRVRIGTLDLRISAIVLASQSILVTRNRRHFAQVPGLHVEDWSLPG